MIYTSPHFVSKPFRNNIARFLGLSGRTPFAVTNASSHRQHVLSDSQTAITKRYQLTELAFVTYHSSPLVHNPSDKRKVRRPT